jgi:hypothetical protein
MYKVPRSRPNRQGVSIIFVAFVLTTMCGVAVWRGITIGQLAIFLLISMLVIGGLLVRRSLGRSRY